MYKGTFFYFFIKAILRHKIFFKGLTIFPYSEAFFKLLNHFNMKKFKLKEPLYMKIYVIYIYFKNNKILYKEMNMQFLLLLF